MNYLRNKLVPQEIRNDINTLKSDVSNIKGRLTGLEQAKQSLTQQTVKSVVPSKTPTVFSTHKSNPNISFLDQIKQGTSLRKTPQSNEKKEVYKAPLLKDIEKGIALKKTPIQSHNKPIGIMDYVRNRNGFEKEMERRRNAIQPDDDF
jgi:hypothetical protein